MKEKDRTYLWLSISAVVVALLSLGARTEGDNTSLQTGQVIGAIVGTFLIATFIWTILWFILGRRKGRPWLSASIGWIAVGMAFVLAVGRSSDSAQAGIG